MAKRPAHHREPALPAVVRQIRELARENTPPRAIASKTGRTPGRIYQIASESNASLRPTNPSPYGRRI